MQAVMEVYDEDTFFEILSNDNAVDEKIKELEDEIYQGLSNRTKKLLTANINMLVDYLLTGKALMKMEINANNILIATSVSNIHEKKLDALISLKAYRLTKKSNRFKELVANHKNGFKTLMANIKEAKRRIISKESPTPGMNGRTSYLKGYMYDVVDHSKGIRYATLSDKDKMEEEGYSPVKEVMNLGGNSKKDNIYMYTRTARTTRQYNEGGIVIAHKKQIGKEHNNSKRHRKRHHNERLFNPSKQKR
jgi:hypothetical protein